MDPQSKVLGLGEVAQVDPRLAVALLGGCGEDGFIVRPDLAERIGDFAAGQAWEMANISGCFTSGAADQCIPGQISNICADLWIRRVTYTVRRPNAFAGNIFKAQSDYYNAKNPNIDFTLLINSYCRYFISPEPSPLENIEAVFDCICPAGLVLRCNSCVTATFKNCRPLLCDDPQSTDPCCGGEVPTNVVITLHGIRMMGQYGACSAERAVLALRRAALLPEVRTVSVP